MSKETQMIMDIAPNLPITDLLEIQQIVLDQLKLRTAKSEAQARNWHSSEMTIEELQDLWQDTFTLEELKEIQAEMKIMRQNGGVTLPPGARSSTELISEDREDRC